MIRRDFNIALSTEEKKGGQIEWMKSMEDLGAFLQKGGLIDMPMRGPKFTWSNKRLGAGHIQIRLDRVISNFAWFSQ